MSFLKLDPEEHKEDRIGGWTIPAWGGMNLQDPPHLIGPNEFQLLRNSRWRGSRMVPRPGLARMAVNPAGSGFALWGAYGNAANHGGVGGTGFKDVPTGDTPTGGFGINWVVGDAAGQSTIIADDTLSVWYQVQTGTLSGNRYFRIVQFPRPVAGEPNILVRDGSNYYGIGVNSGTTSAAIDFTTGTVLGSIFQYSGTYSAHHAMRASNGSVWFQVLDSGLGHSFFHKFDGSVITQEMDFLRVGFETLFSLFKLGSQLWIAGQDGSTKNRFTSYPDGATHIAYPTTDLGDQFNQLPDINYNGGNERNIVIMGSNAYLWSGNTNGNRFGFTKFDGATASWVRYVAGTIVGYNTVVVGLGTNGSFVFTILRDASTHEKAVARFDGAVYTLEGVIEAAAQSDVYGARLYDAAGSRLYVTPGKASATNKAARSNSNDVTVFSTFGSAYGGSGAGPLKFIP